MVEITAREQNKEKRMKRIEDSLRDLWDNIRHTNIWIIGVPEEEEKKKGSEKIFEKIIVKNFPNVGMEIVNQVQEVQRVPYRINPKRNMPRHMLIKLSKIKYKEKILKAAKEKQQITYKGIPTRLIADFSAETLQARREWQGIFKVMKRKKPTNKITLPSNDLIQIRWRNQKLYQQAKAMRTHHHQTSFAMDGKGTSLGGKENTTTRNKNITNGKAHR